RTACWCLKLVEGSEPGIWSFLFVSIKHPGILAAAALRRIHYQRTFAQGNAREATGNDNNFFSVKNKRPEVDVTSFEATVHERGVAGKGNHRLRDVIPRVGLNALAEFIDLRLRSLWPH